MSKLNREWLKIQGELLSDRVERALNAGKLQDLILSEVEPDYETVVDTCARVAEVHDLDPDTMQDTIESSETILLVQHQLDPNFTPAPPDQRLLAAHAVDLARLARGLQP